ncbi:hypothetical protein O181_048206 [Austropuccinia psidii MF-1]|uniref:Uncharacterized protein n=1 Tax=Austropuccinia psidii MF-1 TaxID=1389203 RepID=A0A9Q3DXJ9_9BASI|nr:hypothetical protein [Austropuccinia psidii MF-1]
MISPVPSSINFSTPLLGHHPMVTSLLDRSEVIIGMAMVRGHLFLGRLSPCLVTHGIQTPKTQLTKSPPPRLTRSMYALRANTTAAHARPKWNLMVRGLILSSSHYSPLCNHHQQYTHWIPPSPPVPSSPHSHDDALQEFTDFDYSLSHCPQINQPNLVGALPLAPHDSFCGCNSSK